MQAVYFFRCCMVYISLHCVCVQGLCCTFMCAATRIVIPGNLRVVQMLDARVVARLSSSSFVRMRKFEVPLVGCLALLIVYKFASHGAAAVELEFIVLAGGQPADLQAA